MKLFLVCIMLLMGQAATECPVQCACADHNIDCHARSLTQVPTQGISPHATTLNLSHNNLTSLQHDTFHIGQHFHHVISIDLSFNQIVNVSEHAFSHLKNVLVIDLSENNIRHIQFSHVSSEKLYALNLTHNPHLHLPERGFHLRHLVSLELRSCGLSHIPHHFFAHMNRINILNLRSNKLSFLDAHVFKPCKNLLSLDLSGNKFVNLPFGILQNLGLSVLIRLGNNPFVCDCKTRHAYAKYVSHRESTNLLCKHTEIEVDTYISFRDFFSDHCSHLSTTDRPEELIGKAVETVEAEVTSLPEGFTEKAVDTVEVPVSSSPEGFTEKAVDTVKVPVTSLPDEFTKEAVKPSVRARGAVIPGTLVTILVLFVVVYVLLRVRRTKIVRDASPQRFSLLKSSDEEI